MMAEGYIKYECDWQKQNVISENDIPELCFYREILVKNGLIGAINDNIGYGNISRRYTADHQFIISGSTTGGIVNPGTTHFSLVTGFDIAKNRLTCKGETVASSESLSHASLYSSNHKINVVVHFHHEKLWQQLAGKIPSTSEEFDYGTPGMAFEIGEIAKKTNFLPAMIRMAGHQDGLIAFGGDFKSLTAFILKFL